MNMTAREWAPVVLRLGLAALYLWFGLTQLFDAPTWVGWVPAWVEVFGLEAETVVLLNGALETLLGIALAFGIYVRYAALILTVHLFVIIFEIGLTAIGVRDIGLAFATLALALFGSDRLSLMQRHH